MGVQVPDGYGQATLRWQVSGRTSDAVCTLGYDPDPGDTAEDQATAIDAALVASGLVTAAAMTIGWSYRGVSVTFMSINGPQLAVVTQNIAGTSASTPLPASCCFLIDKRTARGGRSGRGRMYLPSFASGETLVDGAGVVTGSAVTAIQTRITAFKTALETNGYQPVLLHSDGSAPTVISSMTVASVIGTQRRRIR